MRPPSIGRADRRPGEEAGRAFTFFKNHVHTTGVGSRKSKGGAVKAGGYGWGGPVREGGMIWNRPSSATGSPSCASTYCLSVSSVKFSELTAR